LILGILVPSAFFLREKPNRKHQAYGKVKNIPEKVLETSGITLKAALKTPVFYALAFAMLALQFVSGSVQHISGHITSQGLPL
ncbi:MFS transporter, partial [Limosilactobacillus reuteri]